MSQSSKIYNLNHILAVLDNPSTCSKTYCLLTTIAETLKTKYSLLHVVPPLLPYFKKILFPYSALGADEVEIYDELTEEVKESIRTCLNQGDCSFQPGTSISVAFQNQSKAHSIIEEIQQKNVDLLIYNDFFGEQSNFLLSSTVQLLMRECSVPILFAKHKAISSIKKIMIATDLSYNAIQLLAVGYALSFQFKASIDVVSVLSSPKNIRSNHLQPTFSMNSKEYARQFKQLAPKQLKRLVRAVYVPFPYKEAMEQTRCGTHFLIGDPRELIQKVCEKEGTDLLVIGNSITSETKVGQLACEIVKRSAVNILVVPNLESES